MGFLTALLPIGDFVVDLWLFYVKFILLLEEAVIESSIIKNIYKLINFKIKELRWQSVILKKKKKREAPLLIKPLPSKSRLISQRKMLKRSKLAHPVVFLSSPNR